MNMEYFKLWSFLSECWQRSYEVYKVTHDQIYLEHCKNLVACEEIVNPYQFSDKPKQG